MGNDGQRCSFCKRPKKDVKRLVAGPDDAFICDRCVAVCADLIREMERPGTAAPKKAATLEVPTPQALYDRLGEYVIGQERGRKVLAVAACNHYKRLLAPKDAAFTKANILLMGSTGCGKTHLARTLAQILDVPFAIADATSFTAAGYVGDDVEQALVKLWQAAGQDIQRAQRGVVYIDEIDKTARRNHATSRDVGGECVQQGLLKMLEGATLTFKTGGHGSPEITMDTSNVLFICGGAFADLSEQKRERKKNRMGFGAEDVEAPQTPQVTREELTQFGMIPELIGRLPVLVTLDDMDIRTMQRILVEPKDAIYTQYQNLFRVDGSSLVMTQDGAKAIAEKALAIRVGARGLRALVEDLLLDTMFHLPEKPGVYTLNAPAVQEGRPHYTPCLDVEGAGPQD